MSFGVRTDAGSWKILGWDSWAGPRHATRFAEASKGRPDGAEAVVGSLADLEEWRATSVAPWRLHQADGEESGGK